MTRNASLRRRSRLAGAVEQATKVELPAACCGPRYLVRPSMTSACAPTLRWIAEALRDETRSVDAPTLNAVRTFVADGASPFFGLEVARARRELALLRHLVENGERTSPVRRATSGVRIRSRSLAPRPVTA